MEELLFEQRLEEDEGVKWLSQRKIIPIVRMARAKVLRQG